jgi:hypothetical protein
MSSPGNPLTRCGREIFARAGHSADVETRVVRRVLVGRALTRRRLPDPSMTLANPVALISLCLP